MASLKDKIFVWHLGHKILNPYRIFFKIFVIKFQDLVEKTLGNHLYELNCKLSNNSNRSNIDSSLMPQY